MTAACDIAVTHVKMQWVFLFFNLICLTLFSFNAAAQLKKPYAVNVLIDENARENYSYRKENDKRTLAVMMYGFSDPQQATLSSGSAIPKDRKALSAFFHQHFDRVKRDYLTPDSADSMRFVAGEAAFNSQQLNSGPGLDPAKMVGLTLPYGRLTIGGGYTWGEKNPAIMLRQKAEGIFAGAGYDTGRVGFQLSYLTSGQQVAGLKVGGQGIRYDNLMFGTSFRVTERFGLTATIQYRNDKDPLTTGDQQTVFTVGTRWKF